MIIGSFCPLSSPESILFIFIDYYILENNSPLKAALKYKRIQLTDFRTVPTEHFGEKKESVSICAVNLWQLCNMKHCSFPKIYLWSSRTHLTSLILGTMGYFFCCTYHMFYFVELEFDLAEVNLTRHQGDSDVDIYLA